MGVDATFDRLQHEIDDAIAPENLGAEDALQVLERVADYCRSMEEGIKDDLDQHH